MMKYNLEKKSWL